MANPLKVLIDKKQAHKNLPMQEENKFAHMINEFKRFRSRPLREVVS